MPESPSSSAFSPSIEGSPSERWGSSRRSRPPDPSSRSRSTPPTGRPRRRCRCSGSFSSSSVSRPSRTSRRPPGRGRVATGTGLAILAAVSFGLFFVGIDAGADESGSWAVVAARAAAVCIGMVAVLATSTSLRAPRSLLPMLAFVGIVDTFANVLVATATTHGSIGIVAVLSSIYPLVTVVLARLVLGERLSAVKRVGGGVALGGAALVAAG
ncbi:MAG TPA: DMT family transporter [Gaiellaceae bacterium]|nr:DMT family transporter [Gaiellaceae bacterium]